MALLMAPFDQCVKFAGEPPIQDALDQALRLHWGADYDALQRFAYQPLGQRLRQELLEELQTVQLFARVALDEPRGYPLEVGITAPVPMFRQHGMAAYLPATGRCGSQGRIRVETGVPGKAWSSRSHNLAIPAWPAFAAWLAELAEEVRFAQQVTRLLESVAAQAGARITAGMVLSAIDPAWARLPGSAAATRKPLVGKLVSHADVQRVRRFCDRCVKAKQLPQQVNIQVGLG